MANIVGANVFSANVVAIANVVASASTKASANVVASASTKASANKANAVEKNQRCGCYKEDSPDTRCCGIYYCCCPAKNSDKEIDLKRCDCCPNDFHEYWYSGLVQTTSGYGNPAEEINGFCCWFCFPLKFSMFFPCFLGSLVNHSINQCCCDAQMTRNYLF
jgi:hypothetical protein